MREEKTSTKEQAFKRGLNEGEDFQERTSGEDTNERVNLRKGIRRGRPRAEDFNEGKDFQERTSGEDFQEEMTLMKVNAPKKRLQERTSMKEKTFKKGLQKRTS